MTYAIRDWDVHFENHESRKLRSQRWVAMKNKHDGASYRRVAGLPNAVEVFCAWCLLVQIASRMPVRGVLADKDGPLDSADMSAKTGYPPAIFEAAFEALTHPKIAWLEVVKSGESPEISQKTGDSPEKDPNFGKKPAGREGKGIEGKNTVVAPGGAPAIKAPRIALPITDDWIAQITPDYRHLDVPQQYLKAKNWVLANPGRTLTRRFFVNWLNRIEPPPQVNGIVAAPRAETVYQLNQQLTIVKEKIAEVESFQTGAWGELPAGKKRERAVLIERRRELQAKIAGLEEF